MGISLIDSNCEKSKDIDINDSMLNNTRPIEVYSWGYNDCGQLGHGDFINR